MSMQNKFSRHHGKHLERMRGVSMVELLISSALGISLLFGLISFVSVSNLNFAATAHSARIQETGRLAMEVLTEELHRAGFWAGTIYENDLSEIIGGTLAVTPNGSACADLASDFGYITQIDNSLHGADDENTDYACLTSIDNEERYLRGDLLTVRYASGEPTAIDSLAATAPYLKLSAVAGRLFLGEDSGESANQISDARSEVHTLNANTYFVGDSGRTCQGEAIPSLFRVSATTEAATPQVQELLPGIEQLQVQYLESLGPNTVSHRDADEVLDWNAVVGIKLWVVARAQCPERQIESLQGELEDLVIGDIAYEQNPKFRRSVFQQVISRRNTR